MNYSNNSGSKLEMSSVLLVGSSAIKLYYECIGDDEERLVNTVSSQKNSTFSWVDATIWKKIPVSTYDIIIISPLDLVSTDDEIDTRILNIFLCSFDTVSKDNTLVIVKEPYYDNLCTIMTSIHSYSIVEENEQMITLKYKPPVEIKELDDNVIQVEPIQPTHKIIYKKREYKRIDISLEPYTNDSIIKSSKRITAEEFGILIQDKEFIKRLCDSQQELLTYKLSFYNEKIIELKEDIKKMSRVVNGLSFETIRTLYPQSLYNRTNLIQYENIVEKIKVLLSKGRDEAGVYTRLRSILDKDLPSIVGREEIKEMILYKIVLFTKCWNLYINSFHNFIFEGKSGIGKTTLAKLLSTIYSKSGLFITDCCRVYNCSDFIGVYVGQTEPKTRSLILENLEGVIVIDEAYVFAQGGENDYGKKAIGEIVYLTDVFKGMHSIIMNGYKENMKDVHKLNQGLNRRFSTIPLRDYSVEELSDIFISNLEKILDEEFDETVHDTIYSILYSIINEKGCVPIYQAADMVDVSVETAENLINASENIDTIEMIKYSIIHKLYRVDCNRE